METIKLSLFQPTSFFERMRVDNAEGTLSYYWINAAFGALVGYFWQAAMAVFGVSLGGSSMSGSDNPLAAVFDQQGPFFYIIAGVVAAALAPIGLYLSAGIIHLGAMLFKSADRGFNATLRTVAYSSGTNLLQVIPFCGSFLASIWTLVLIVIGLWKTQRSSVGAALGAVLLPIFVITCCACGAIGLVMAFAGAAIAGSFGQ